MDEDLVNRLYVEHGNGCKGCTVYRDVHVRCIDFQQIEKIRKKNFPLQTAYGSRSPPENIEADVVRFQNNKEKWVAFVACWMDMGFTGLRDDDEVYPVAEMTVFYQNIDRMGTKRDVHQFENKRGYKTTIEGLSEKFNKGILELYETDFWCTPLPMPIERLSNWLVLCN